jgi:phospholipase/carboxylesterase
MQMDQPMELSFQTVGSGQPQALLLLLHGVGGNEGQLEDLARMHDPRVRCVLPRGPLTFGPDSFAWFQVRFGAQGPSIDPDQAEASRMQLVRFITGLQRQTGIGRERTVIAGFSQGGIMSAGLALTRPDLVAGFGLLSGRILPEIEPLIADPASRRGLSGFLSHGLQDQTLPVSWADRSDRWLAELGVPCESHRYPAGHQLTREMAEDFGAWLHRLLWA